MLKNFIKFIFSSFFLYVFIAGLLIFSKPQRIPENYKNTSSTSDYYSNDIGPDRVVLIHDPLESGVARIKIIENATETLDISYFSIEKGETPSLFFGALIEAADRGVKVNLLLDGIFHGMKGDLKDTIYTFAAHPNIELRYYEPFNPLLPWTGNNRMHDKYIVADNKIAIIGGRNIGDKYFNPDWYNNKITNDMDIVIVHADQNNQDSVLHQLSSYYELVWNHPYTKPSIKKLSNFQYKKGVKKGQILKENAKNKKEMNKALFEKEFDLAALSLPTNKITLITNPISRFTKEPWIWYEITQLMQAAKKSVFIQSPYVIPSKQMTSGYIHKDTFENIDVSILTNSLASTPNPPAYSGYLNHRKKIVDHNINVYELQSQHSTHGKSFVIDDDLVLIGSFNLDSRSAYLSTESMVAIHSNDLVEKFKEGAEEYISHSLLIGPDYNYIPKDGVKEEKINPIKKMLIKSLSYITRFFEYLL